MWSNNLKSKEVAWYCVHTKPLKEEQAVAGLLGGDGDVSSLGPIQSYYPRIRTKMKVGGQLRTVTRPLFPRYFFAKFFWNSAARYIQSRRNVIGIVQSGRIPILVPEKIIEDLRAISLNSDDGIFDPLSGLLPGSRVLISTGIFKGMEAEFVAHLSDGKRVKILLDCLQGSKQMILDRDLLKTIV